MVPSSETVASNDRPALPSRPAPTDRGVAADSIVASDQPVGLQRRHALCSMVGIGALGVVLAACGSDDKSDSGGPKTPSNGASSEAGVVLAPTADVPVGGGIKVTDPNGLALIVTQPTQGVFKAFDARCTHMQTVINPPKGGIMTCPNHGSQFRAADGSVVRSPASRPLKQVNIAVHGPNIVTA